MHPDTLEERRRAGEPGELVPGGWPMCPAPHSRLSPEMGCARVEFPDDGEDPRREKLISPFPVRGK